MGKIAPFFFLPSPSSTGTGEAQGGAVPWALALPGTAVAGERGKRERRPRGSDSPTHC